MGQVCPIFVFIIALWGIVVNGKLRQSWYNFIEVIGQMLKEYRKKKNISQEKLEELTNIDRKTIFRIENDLNMPLLDTFAKIVVALNLSDEEIATEVKKVLQKNNGTDT